MPHTCLHTCRVLHCLFILARKVWRELKINLRISETRAIVAWFDRSTTKKLHACDLCDAIFGTGGSGSSLRRPPPPPPPSLPQKPHAVQAQRSAALANGESSSGLGCPPRIPARDIHASPERRRQQIESGKIAWNWQGRRVSSAAAGATRHKEGGEYTVKDEKRVIHGGGARGSAGEGPVRSRGVLHAGGEAVVAEKARIEKRLKELQRERAMLLREKTGLGRGWEERGRRAGSPIAIATNKCGG